MDSKERNRTSGYVRGLYNLKRTAEFRWMRKTVVGNKKNLWKAISTTR